jgi:predicted Zn-dependent protease
MAESKRLAFLLKLTSASVQGSPSPFDPFAWYGLAMEYRSLERTDEALATFETLRARAPDYVPMYLMCGQMLETLGRLDDARAWLASGVMAARTKGDTHALGELESAIAALPS